MDKKWYQYPWYEWIGWFVWLVVTVIFLQTAIASKAEMVNKAALLSWIIFFVLIAIAVAIWAKRLTQQKK